MVDVYYRKWGEGMMNPSFQQVIRAVENNRHLSGLESIKVHVCGIRGSIVVEGDDKEFHVTYLLPALPY